MKMFYLDNFLTHNGWTEESITKIYHGGDHVCRCGCAGRYFERGTPGFTRALNALKHGILTEEKGDKVWVSGYGHDEMQTSDGVEASGSYINIPEAMDEHHNKCYCLYRD